MIDESEQFAVGSQYGVAHLTEGTVAEIHTVRLDMRPEKNHAVTDILQVYLFRVYRQPVILFQMLRYFVPDIEQILLVVMHKENVVHIAPIMFYFQYALDIVVEIGQIDIAEYLASEIADWQSASFGRVEQAFRGGQTLPVFRVSFGEAVYRRVVEYDLAEQVNGQVGNFFTQFARTDDPLHLFKKYLSVDGHEEALNVEFEDVCRGAVVIGYRAHVVLYPLYAIRGTEALATRVAVPYKSALEQVVYVVVYEMMHDPVFEIGGEYFTFHGVIHDEIYTFADLVRPVVNLRCEFEKIMLEIHFEFELVDRVPLIFSCCKICAEQIAP